MGATGISNTLPMLALALALATTVAATTLTDQAGQPIPEYRVNLKKAVQNDALGRKKLSNCMLNGNAAEFLHFGTDAWVYNGILGECQYVRMPVPPTNHGWMLDAEYIETRVVDGVTADVFDKEDHFWIQTAEAPFRVIEVFFPIDQGGRPGTERYAVVDSEPLPESTWDIPAYCP